LSPNLSEKDLAAAKALVNAKKGADRDMLQVKIDLLEEADKILPFQASDGTQIHLRKLSWGEATRIIFAKMPETLNENEPLKITIQTQLRSYEAACEALSVASIQALTPEQVGRAGKANGGKDFVDEAVRFLMEQSYLTPKKVEDLQFFRRIRRRLWPSKPMPRKPGDLPLSAIAAGTTE
jgi:hypothetical protein